eukprot:s1009_g21.t1
MLSTMDQRGSMQAAVKRPSISAQLQSTNACIDRLVHGFQQWRKGRFVIRNLSQNPQALSGIKVQQMQARHARQSAYDGLYTRWRSLPKAQLPLQAQPLAAMCKMPSLRLTGNFW